MKKILSVRLFLVCLLTLGMMLVSCDSGGGDSGWDGQDVSNWPWDSGNSYYFRVTNDKQIMAVNFIEQGDGRGNAIPAIYKVQQNGKGTFPVGTWIEDNDTSQQYALVFTDTTLTRFWRGTPILYNYTISGDKFILSDQ